MVAIVNASGVVQERYSYDAYGTVTFLTGAFAIRIASLFAWETLYAGYRRDSESRLYQVRSRVLDPLLGWLQRDPLGLSAGINLIQYAGSSPLATVDPTGLICDIPKPTCREQFTACLASSKRSFETCDALGASWRQILNCLAQRLARDVVCDAVFVACQAAELGNQLRYALQQAADWLIAHPGVVIGTFVVILGITFVVATGGAGAPVLILLA